MSALAVDSQLDFWTTQELVPAGRPALAAVVSDQPVGGERTLEDLILGAWEELAAHQPVNCPMCGGQLAPEYGAHTWPVRGTCRDCGTQLS
jgi:hypothetical protein